MKQSSTSADLSDRTESATSFAFHVLLSLEVKKRELGGPICMKKIEITKLELYRYLY